MKFRKALKILSIVAMVGVLCLFLFYYLLQRPGVQTFLTQKVTEIVSSQIDANVSIGNVNIKFFRRLKINDLYIEDQHEDTLLYSKQLYVKVGMLNLLRKKIELKKIDFDQLKINFHRGQDTVYNFKFLTKQSSTEQQPKKPSKPYEITLHDIAISNFDFTVLDEYKFKKIAVRFDRLALQTKNFNPQKKEVYLKNIEIDGANVSVKKLFNPLDSLKEQKIPRPKSINNAGWHIQSDEVKITNSTFANVDENKPLAEAGMDYTHLLVSDINIELAKTEFLCDTIFSDIKHLSAKEKSGFQIVKMSTQAKVSTAQIECKNLELVTPNSKISNYLSLSYGSFADFKEFVTKVYLTGGFKNSQLALKDINYFAKGALEKIKHNTIDLSGRIRGTVSNLKGRKLVMNIAGRSEFEGNFTFRGLPDFDETFITLEVSKVRTSLQDLKVIYPHVKYPDDLAKFGRVSFAGEFVGFNNDFVANGQLQTDIGYFDSDINFKIDEATQMARYSGSFKATDFEMGKWFDNEDLLGAVTLNTSIKGAGLKLKNLDATLNGKIQKLTLHQHDYEDININGTVKDRYFQGFLAIKDNNLDLDFQGKLDLNDSIPVFQFASNLNKANLKELNLTKEDYQLQSNLHLDFKGKDLDNFVGYAGIFNTTLEKDQQVYKLDSFELDATPVLEGTAKILTLKSDVADAHFTGQFKYKQLPKALKQMFEYYTAPDKLTADTIDQKFGFHGEIRNTNNLTQLFAPALKNIESGYFSGDFDGPSHNIKLNSYITGATYSKIGVKGLSFNTFSDSNYIRLTTSVDTLLVNDSLLTNDIVFDSKIKQDSILFHFTVQKDSMPNRADLNGILQTDLKSFTLNLLPSTVHLANNPWKVDQSNKIYYSAKQLEVDHLLFTSAQSEVEFKTFKDAIGKSHLSIFLRNLDLHNVTQPLITNPKLNLYGTLNGSAVILNVLEDPDFITTLMVDSFQVNKERLGNINLKSTYKPEDETVEVEGTLLGENNDLKVSGHYGLGENEEGMNLTCDIKQLHLPHLEGFVQKDVSKIKGDMSGQLKITGDVSDPVVTGKVTIDSAQARINYLNTVYRFNHEELIFTKHDIDLNEITLLDVRNKKAFADGHIRYSSLKDINFDIEIETEDFQFLNTTSSTSEPFYGEVYAGGLVFIRGPAKKVEFIIAAQTREKTKFAIDVASTKDVEEYSFYRFINTNKEQKKTETYKTKLKGIKLDLDIAVTPDAEIRVILNADDQDEIYAHGSGDIKVALDKGELNVVGNYNIDKGQYDFTMQNIISKKFKLVKGSSIIWNGDVTGAQVNIKAEYRLRATPYDLIDDMVTGDDAIQQAKNRVPVYLYLYLTGSLLTPDIRFDIEVPDADPAIRTALETKFQVLRSDPNAFNKQVVGLLVLNRFLPEQQGGTTDPISANDVGNSVSEFLSNQLSQYLSEWLTQFVTEVEIDINYRTYQSEITGVQNQIDFKNRQELQLALSKSFLKDRITIDVGGNFDFGDNNTATGSTDQNQRVSNIAGDFEIEYSITPDGRLKISAFRKGEYDIFQNRNKNKTGIGISYKREFDSVKDFFQNIRKKREERRRKEELEATQ